MSIECCGKGEDEIGQSSAPDCTRPDKQVNNSQRKQPVSSNIPRRYIKVSEAPKETWHQYHAKRKKRTAVTKAEVDKVYNWLKNKVNGFYGDKQYWETEDETTDQ